MKLIKGWRGRILECNYTRGNYVARLVLQHPEGEAHILTYVCYSYESGTTAEIGPDEAVLELVRSCSRDEVEAVCHQLFLNGRVYTEGPLFEPYPRVSRGDLAESLFGLQLLLCHTLDPSEVSQIAIEQGTRTLRANTGALSLKEDDGWRVERTFGNMVVLNGAIQEDSAELYADLALHSRQVVTIEDSFTDLRANDEHLRSQTIKSVLVAPIVLQNQPYGAVCIHYSSEPHRFSAEEIRYATCLGVLISIAENQAQLFRLSAPSNQILAVDKVLLLEVEPESLEVAQELTDQVRKRDEFLAILSHELRSPLAPISAALHVLRLNEGSSDEPIRVEAMTIIDRQLGNLRKLIDDLLEVSRVVSGRIHLDKQPIEIQVIIEHALEIMEPILADKHHEVLTHLPPGPVWVNADATQPEGVLVNLLSNAAKYTPDFGLIEITASTSADIAQVVIRDSGIGVDPEILPHIFEVFAQADRSLDRAEGGMGIGLSLSHRLVSMHGGTLTAMSPAKGCDLGSEFTIQLPAHYPSLGRAELLDSGLAAREVKPLRILVVDDNRDLAAMIAELLGRDGHSVQTAHDGEAGIEIVTEWKPHIVLLDIGLPGRNGLEVVRELKSTYGSKILAVAITGYGRAQDIAEALHAGFDTHLIKPFGYESLRTLISNFENQE